MSTECPSGNCSSEMSTIHFEYIPGDSILTDDMRIFIDGKRYNLKKDGSLEVQLPSGKYHTAFKSSILGTNLEIDATKDVNVTLGWTSAGKIAVKIN